MMLLRRTHLIRKPLDSADTRPFRHAIVNQSFGGSARPVLRYAAADAVGTQDLIEDVRAFVADELPRIFKTGVRFRFICYPVMRTCGTERSRG